MISLQDFIHGVDFTGINPATGADHNNLVDQSAPVSDSATEGKGLILWTKDPVAGTPDVPDPTGLGASKWKRYIWARVLIGPDAPIAPILYGWNDAAFNNVTYLKWQPLIADFTQVNAEILALQNQIAAIQATAVNAQTVANQANTTANTANTNSNNALTQIAGAVNTANAAKAEADTAITDVNNLQIALNALQAQLNTLVNTTVPNLTALTGSSIVLAEQANSTVNLGAIVAGANLRSINTKVFDAQNIVTLGAGKITFNIAGTFLISAKVPFVPEIQAGDTLTVQSFVKKDSDNSVLITGQSNYASITGAGGFHDNTSYYSTVEGIITVVPNQTIRIDMHANAAKGLLGAAAQDGSGNFPAGTKEQYTVVTIKQLQ